MLERARWTARRAGVTLETLRSRGFAKVDLGQGPAPHAEGGFSHPDGKLRSRRLAGRRRARPAAPLRPARRGGRRGLAERFPLAMITPKTHLFLNSTFANQARQHGAQPEPFVVLQPRRRGGPRRWPTATRARVFNDRGSFVCPARVSDDARPGVVVAPMGWWSGDYEGGVGGQATTSQGLTEAGRGADLQRQPGGGGASLGTFAAARQANEGSPASVDGPSARGVDRRLTR